MTLRAHIAGAGFAGLAAATILARAGWSVTVHEMADTPRSAGSGIYLHPFAQNVLREIGAFDRLAGATFAPAARTIHIDGTPRSTTDMAGHVRTTTRAALHAAVLETALAAGAQVQTRSHAIQADPAGALLMANGQRLPADLVVAADGVRSALATQAGFNVHRRRHQDGVTRVLLDRDGLRSPMWDDIHDFYDYRHTPLRILYTPCGDDAFYFCLMAPAGDVAGAAVPIDVALWSRSFPQLAATLARIGPLGRHDRYTTTTLDRWSLGRLAVVGDAAHAMPSSLGQGAGVSMLNAVRLAQAVASAPDVPAGLAAWEAQTRPIVEGWQSEAEGVATGRSLAGAVHPGTDFVTEQRVARGPAAAAAG